jgi:hypothetical protein
MPHRPEVCYPGNGWTLEDKRRVNLPLSDGTELECQILNFSRSGMSSKRITVLNYYIVDGEYCPDVSLLRGKVLGNTGYVAQMQITCSGGGSISSKSSVDAVSAFAVDSTRSIYDLFPRSEEDLKDMWALYDKILAEYKIVDPQGHAKLMNLHVPEHEAQFRAKVGKMMGKRTGVPKQSTTIPSPASNSEALSGGRDNE